MKNALCFLLLSLQLLSSASAFEYEKPDGWYAATQNTRVELVDIRSIVMHSNDEAMDHDGNAREAIVCKDGIRGASDWFSGTPTCDKFMKEHGCIQCQSMSRKCCSLDLECSPCMAHLDVNIDKPHLICEPYQGITIRAVDPSSCVLEFTISQDRNLLGMEVGIVCWIVLYNLVVFFTVITVHRSWILRVREFALSLLCSGSIVIVFFVYVYLKIWYVYGPFYVAYLLLCLLPLFRLYMYRKKAKTKKEMV